MTFPKTNRRSFSYLIGDELLFNFLILYSFPQEKPLQQKKQYSEPDLILLLKGKDQRGYNYLYDNYAPALYGIIVKIIGDREEATDVLQECFIEIWKSIENYDSTKGRLFTWMLQITRNAAIDFARSAPEKKGKRTNRLEPNLPTIEQSNITYLPVDHLGLTAVIEGLRNEDKEIVDLAYFKGFTQKEIADELSIPLGTVKTRARNALIQLKNILKKN